MASQEHALPVKLILTLGDYQKVAMTASVRSRTCGKQREMTAEVLLTVMGDATYIGRICMGWDSVSGSIESKELDQSPLHFL